MRSTRARNDAKLAGTWRATTNDFDAITWTPLAAAAGSTGAPCVEARTGSLEPAPRRAASSGARVDPLSKTTTALGCPAPSADHDDRVAARESTTKVVALTVRPAERASLRKAVAPSAAACELERTRTTRLEVLPLGGRHEQAGLVRHRRCDREGVGERTRLEGHGEGGVAGGGGPERAYVVEVRRIVQGQKGSHEKRDLFLVHQVQQGLIVDSGIGAIVLVEQFQTPMGREDAPGGVDRVDTQLEAEQLGTPGRAIGPAQRKGGTHLDDGRGVAAPSDRIDGRGHTQAGRGVASRQDGGGHGHTNQSDHDIAGATSHVTATPRYDSITYG